MNYISEESFWHALSTAFNVAMQKLHSFPYKLPLNKYAYWYKHLCEDHSLHGADCVWYDFPV